MQTRFDGTIQCALVAVLLTAFFGAAFGGEITISTAVLEGDAVEGVGAVTRIDNVAINNGGEFIVEADTDNADTNADSVMLRGFLDSEFDLFLREGQGLDAPVGATLDSFDSVNINATGHSAWNFFLDNTVGIFDDSGIYYDDVLVIQEGDVSTAEGFTDGTPYIGFFDVKMNDSNVAISILSVDDPVIPTTVDRALVKIEIGEGGVLLSEEVLVKETDVLPGQVNGVTEMGIDPHESAFNDLGDVMFLIEPGSSTAEAIYINNGLIAQEGSPSIVEGRNWEFLGGRTMDLNNSGDYAFKANITGDTADDEMIVLNESVFVREGDTVAALGEFAFTSFGLSSGPVDLDDDGNILWYGDWDDANTDTDTGLFWNHELIVQEGVTQINGMVVDTIANGQDAFELSDSGEWAIFEATLAGGLDGAFLIHFGGGAVDATIVAANSVLTHGAGPGTELAIDLFVSNGVEPRQGGPAKLEFEMSELMDRATVDGMCDNVQIECVVGPNPACGNVMLADDDVTVVVELAGVITDENCCSFSFAGMRTAFNGAVPNNFPVFALQGDVNFSGAVTGSDPSLVKPHFGEIVGVDLAGPQFDYDRNGGVTGGDFALIKPRLGNVGPECE